MVARLVLGVLVSAVAVMGATHINPPKAQAAWGGYRYTCTYVAAWHKYVCGWQYDPNCPDWYPEDGVCDA
jgi:hypothetical protein